MNVLRSDLSDEVHFAVIDVLLTIRPPTVEECRQHGVVFRGRSADALFLLLVLLCWLIFEQLSLNGLKQTHAGYIAYIISNQTPWMGAFPHESKIRKRFHTHLCS